jgi:hypothetical protein
MLAVERGENELAKWKIVEVAKLAGIFLKVDDS